jgi:hypothetical protein
MMRTSILQYVRTLFLSAALCAPALASGLAQQGTLSLPGQPGQSDTCSASADTCSSAPSQQQPLALPSNIPALASKIKPVHIAQPSVPGKPEASGPAQAYQPEILHAAPDKESHIKALPLFVLFFVFLGLRIYRYNTR